MTAPYLHVASEFENTQTDLEVHSPELDFTTKLSNPLSAMHADTIRAQSYEHKTHNKKDKELVLHANAFESAAASPDY